MGLRGKFLLGSFTLVAIVVALIGYMTLWSEQTNLKEEFKKRHFQLVERLARVCEESLYQNDISLFNYLKSLKTEPGFQSAFFIDVKGTIQVHSDTKRIGQSLDPASLSDAPYSVIKQQNHEPVIYLTHPIQFEGKPVGTAVIYLSQSEIGDQISALMIQTLKRIFLISLLAMAVGLLGALIFSTRMVTPIRRVIDGMRKIAEGDLTPIKESNTNDEVGWMIHELNLTMRKLKEVDEMKQELSNAVTHELRSPLTAIDQFVNLNLSGRYGPLTPKQQDSLLTIKNNVVRLSRFVDDLLTAAKIEAGHTKLYNEHFPAMDVIKDVIQLFTPLAEEKGLNLIDARNNALASIWGDRSKIHQMLSNFVSNAIKFTDKGQITVNCSTDGKQTTISVEDTGVGIPPEKKENLFIRFSRLHEKTRHSKGTGLGLSIVKSFAELHNGSVAVSDNPGGGSRFSFTLPSQPN